MLTTLIRYLLRLAAVGAAVTAGVVAVLHGATMKLNDIRLVSTVTTGVDANYERDAPTSSNAVVQSAIADATEQRAIREAGFARLGAIAAPTLQAGDSRPKTQNVPITLQAHVTPAVVKHTVSKPVVTRTVTPKPVTATAPATHPVVQKALASVKIAAVLAFARAQIGEPYILGAMGPSAWDCSGLTKAAFASVGINIGTHSSNSQYYTARNAGYLVPYSERRAGDLIFYYSNGDYYHVTIYSGNGMMIEAPNPVSRVREVPVRSADRVAYVARFIR